MSQEEESEEDGISPQTSPQRAIARAEIPAVFVDTWGFTTWQGHVRITLGENLGNRAYYRSAFVMDLENAEDFAVRLFAMVRKRREKEDALKAEKLMESVAPSGALSALMSPREEDS